MAIKRGTMEAPVIYLIGSLRNPEVPLIGDSLREAGFETFDEWHSAGEIADDCFRDYCNGRGLTYREALQTYAAKHIFDFDKTHLTRASIVVLVMPGGKSAHLELGWALGQGKAGYVLFDKIPDRYDQMYQFANDMFFSKEEMVNELKLKHLS